MLFGKGPAPFRGWNFVGWSISLMDFKTLVSPLFLPCYRSLALLPVCWRNDISQLPARVTMPYLPYCDGLYLPGTVGQDKSIFLKLILVRIFYHRNSDKTLTNAISQRMKNRLDPPRHTGTQTQPTSCHCVHHNWETKATEVDNNTWMNSISHT